MIFSWWNTAAEMNKKEELFKKVFVHIEKSPVAFSNSVYFFKTKEFGIKINFKDVRDFER